MEQANRTTQHALKGKHLNREERIQIEVLRKAATSPVQIAQRLGRHERTIERELRAFSI